MTTSSYQHDLAIDAELYNQRAAKYGADSDDLSHSISEESEPLYPADLEEAIGPLTRYPAVLEVGAGNGVLTCLLNKWGVGEITGTDISEGMLGIARARLPHCDFKLVLSEHDPSLSPSARFDLIISRQVACHFVDPIAVFSCWKAWLKPGGRIVLIDGLWTRRDWGPPGSATQMLADRRPLACTQTMATVCYLLERAQLKIEHCALLSRVNSYAKATYTLANPREPILRYLVVAV